MNPSFSKKQIAQSFDRFARQYDKHAVVQKEIGSRLLERAQCLTHTPNRILDVGAGTGGLYKPLQHLFPKATVFEIDIAWGMLKASMQTTSRWQFFKPQKYLVQADMETLPFKDNSFDLIVSNCAFQWSNDLPALFQEMKRVLSPEGTLLFTTLGPDTLKEIKQIWASVDDKIHVHEFIDLHPVGDLILKTGLKNPVIDQDIITVTYNTFKALLQDLKNTGARNLSPLRSKGLMTPAALKKVEEAFESNKSPGEPYLCTYEVIYGHARKEPAPFQDKPLPIHVKTCSD